LDDLKIESDSFIDFGLKEEVVDEEFGGVGIVLTGEISRVQDILYKQENPAPGTELINFALNFTIFLRVSVVTHLHLDLTI
jgi:hypothetical protein